MSFARKVQFPSGNFLSKFRMGPTVIYLFLNILLTTWELLGQVCLLHQPEIGQSDLLLLTTTRYNSEWYFLTALALRLKVKRFLAWYKWRNLGTNYPESKVSVFVFRLQTELLVKQLILITLDSYMTF